MLVSILKKHGWKLGRKTVSSVGSRIEIWSSGSQQQTLVIQQAPDIRPETIRGRLALAMLDAQRQSTSAGATAAIVTARTLSRVVVDGLAEIGGLVPGIGWGVVGDNGRVVLRLAGLELSIEPSVKPRVWRVDPVVADPFSDLGLWITKVLIKRTLANANDDWNAWLTGPNTYFGTYDAFAAAVGVATKTAWQTIHALDALGYVAGAAAAAPLVKVEELLTRIRGATRDPTRRLECRWLLPRHDALQRLLAGRLTIEHGFHNGTRVSWREGPRLCLAGFSAARAHALSVTNVQLAEVHVEPEASLEALGLVRTEPGERSDVVLHRAKRPEAVFRAAVLRDGLPCADLVQTWLDVVDHPQRGNEQARRLREAMFG